MSDYVRRYSRIGRWFHAGVYLTVTVALVTGWWFIVDGYRNDSPLARLTGLPDAAIHEYSGYAFTVVILIWLPLGLRGIGGFVRETLRMRRGDGRWLVNWPRAVFTGRFGEHDGHFDPGQRLANVVIVLGLLVLVLTGLGLLWTPALGPDLLAIHRWTTLVLTPIILGHIVVASGILPGYRGVWRSMHLGGRLPVDVARRIWPGWLRDHMRDRR